MFTTKDKRKMDRVFGRVLCFRRKTIERLIGLLIKYSKGIVFIILATFFSIIVFFTESSKKNQ